MGEQDDFIRRLASQLSEEDEQRRLAEQQREQQRAERAERAARSDAEHRERQRKLAELKAERAKEVLQLCSRFVVWATDHGIPYNQGMLFWTRRGWLLGHRKGPPWHGGGGGEFGHSGTSSLTHYSLLVHRSRPLKELIIKDPALSPRVEEDSDVGSIRRADPGAYDISTIEESIARFSVAHQVEW